MSKPIDLTDQTFGKLTVIALGSKNKYGTLKWICQCSCGSNPKEVFGTSLRNGHTKSCGCLQKVIQAERKTKHGMRKSSTYHCWTAMIQRCVNINNPGFKDYGARGITVCDRWLNSFENFLEDMGEKPRGLSLDRIEVNGNYEPSNCRWASDKEQSRNKRNNVLLNFNNKTQCLTDWAEELGVSRHMIEGRLRRGWDPQKALATPPKTKAA